MVDLSTSYLGLTLKSPLILAASPISKTKERVAEAVEAGAGAVIMHSLFEEQLMYEQLAVHRFIDSRLDFDAEARGFLPHTDQFAVDDEPYLREIEGLRGAVDVPVIASLNGTTPGGWTSYARRLEQAGASAIELNLYDVATGGDVPGAEVERRHLEVVTTVVQTVSIPVTVKLTPFYASVPAFARSLEQAGARGVAVFNRFLQPDVDLDTLDVQHRFSLSNPTELPLRLHALAILSAQTGLSLACTGGVHTGLHAAKALLSGAHVVQLASVLLQRGPRHLSVLLQELDAWLEEKGYSSSAEARGVLDLSSAPDPHAWERLSYIRLLEGWRPDNAATSRG
jgi:dihydroorotate dehydrogenase (fumarate)